MNGGRTLRFTGSRIQAAAVTAIAAIFFVDMNAPLGLGVPFLYLLVALGAIWAGAGGRLLLAVAVACTALTLAKLGLDGVDGALWLGQRNRGIFVLLLWTTVGLEFLRRRVEAREQAAQRRFAQELEKQVAERTAELARVNRELQGEVAERQRAEQTVQAYAARLQGLAAQLVETRESERKHLAAELHDRIGQNLSALSINLSLNLAQLPPAAEAARARLADSLALVEKTTEMVRGVMEELHPALLDQYGLEVAVRWYGEEFARRTGIAVATEAPELFPRLRGKVETTLFRIVQEALTNVAKHAQATRAVAALARTPAGIVLTVADDGVGIPPEAARSPAIGSGWGLAIMAERVRAIGADWRIEPGAAGGTRIVVEVPNGAWESEIEHHGIDRR
jgi:signal transduction histidine kinase